MRSFDRVAALAAAVALAVAAAAYASQPPVTVTAPAGVTTISAATLTHWVRIARHETPRETERFLQRAALTVLIAGVWIRGEAAEEGIRVTSAQVRAEMARDIRESFPKRRDFLRFLRSSGQTLADIRFHVRLDLLSTRLRDRVIRAGAASVTDAQVDAAVKARGPMKTAEIRDIRVVLTHRRAVALAARRALEAGGTWWSVARRYSEDDVSRDNGGLLPGLRRRLLEPRLDRAVFRARRGRLVGPVRTEFGYYVFEVVRIRRPTVIPLERERAIIRRRLVVRAEQDALDRFVREFEARWRARTVCAPAYTWHPDCSNYDGTPVEARTRK